LAAALAPEEPELADPVLVPELEPPEPVLVPVLDPELAVVAAPAPAVVDPPPLLLLPHPATATAHISGTAAEVHLVQLRIALLHSVP
jgi:hypothetical protein